MSQLLFKYNSGEKMIKSREILQDLDDVKNIMIKNLSKEPSDILKKNR